ncbi:MAG: hypothetical protein AXA67_06830 [Methylothermaceae bacteria B42]|nr:MAG: hypothetical protein AXA67_06830 [Methylothermaceae bacteria B42]HHJ40261.1 outer membrane protein assembly factor BamD [Methylothermaceae bacterium]
MRVFFITLWLISIGLAGCSTIGNWFSNTSKEVEILPEEELYEQAKEKLEKGQYTRAIELYQALETRYPFGRRGPQALLDLAYAYYKQGETESALTTVDRFIKLHPTHQRLDYAYYLRGLINYRRGMGVVERFFPIDLTKRDMGPARDAYKDFVTLLEKFPDSEYAEDARKRKISLLNAMAAHEVHVADFYMRRGAYLAAATRAGRIVKEYSRTPSVPFALKIMEEAYTILELDDLAADAARVYAVNYGESLPRKKEKEKTLLGWIFWFFRWD